GSRRFGGSRHPREVDLHRRAAPRLAVDPDVAAALLDDSVNGREPEPRAFPYFLGGEERLEEVRLRGLIHAHAGVRHHEAGVVARRKAVTPLEVLFVPGESCRLDAQTALPR